MIIHIPRSPYYLSHFDFLSTSSQLWSQKMTPLSTEVSNCWGPQLHQLKISRIWSFAITFNLVSQIWIIVGFGVKFWSRGKMGFVSNPAVKYPAICQLSHRRWLPIEFIYGAIWLQQWFFRRHKSGKLWSLLQSLITDKQWTFTFNANSRGQIFV